MVKVILKLIIIVLIVSVRGESYAQVRGEDFESAKVGNIEVKAFLKENTRCDSQHSRYYIKFEIKNKSSKTIKINKTFLPWENGSNTFTQAILDNGEIFNEITLLPCLGVCEELIEPDETIVGCRELNFGDEGLGIIDFDKTTKFSSVVLVWTFIPDIHINTSKFSGKFVVPKQE